MTQQTVPLSCTQSVAQPFPNIQAARVEAQCNKTQSEQQNRCARQMFARWRLRFLSGTSKIPKHESLEQQYTRRQQNSQLQKLRFIHLLDDIDD